MFNFETQIIKAFSVAISARIIIKHINASKWENRMLFDAEKREMESFCDCLTDLDSIIGDKNDKSDMKS